MKGPYSIAEKIAGGIHLYLREDSDDMVVNDSSVKLLAQTIITLRRNKGISQELLAENSRVSLRTIQRIESGASIARDFTIKNIATALGVDVAQLTFTTVDSGENRQQEDYDKLRLINFSTLAVLIIPLSNIIVPLMIWSRNKDLSLTNRVGRHIISFQILWTIVAFLASIVIHSILHSVAKSVNIGRLPPTIFLIYIFFLVINLCFTLHAAGRLSKNKADVYSFVPSLL